MTGTTTGQTSLTTATDSDDTEIYLTTGLVAALQAVANLFESATGHDHSGAGKGKPIVTAGFASGVTLTSPHFTTPVVDSGGLTITAGGLTVTSGGLTLTAAPLIVGSGNVAGAGSIRLPNNVSIDWRNAANSADNTIGYDASDRLVLGTAVATAGNPGTTFSGALTVVINGTPRQIPFV